MTPSKIPHYRPLQLNQSKLIVRKQPDGSLIISSSDVLKDYPLRLMDRLIHWANKYPDRICLAKRDGQGEWQYLSYGKILDQVRRIGQALLNRGLSAERPLLILSDNDLENAVMALAATYAGIAYAPISPAYSLLSRDFEKLNYIARLLTPGLVFASDGDIYNRALESVFADVDAVVTRNANDRSRTTLFAELLATEPTTVDQVQAATDADTIVKFLFTSGSTKLPKAVINTNRMICSNLQMMVQIYPFLTDEPPILVDWLPWNHTFGGNQNFSMTFFLGGTLYIDEGKPTPQGIQATIRNLREISPTIYYNVPKGFEEIAHAMQSDVELRRSLLRRVKMFFYAGAGLSQAAWDALHELAEAECGERIVMLTGLGMTETAPSCLFVNRAQVKSGMVGVPTAGLEAKLVEAGDKLEVRYRGPNVMPGYWRLPDETKAAFDAEGFFCSGDAVKFIDESNHDLGLVFDGRIAEDFKLNTGTWVSVGPLRALFNTAAAPYVMDTVVTGINQPEIGLLIFPNLATCQKLSALPSSATTEQVLSSVPVREKFIEVLTQLAAIATGSASRITRAVLMVEPPSLSFGEITDKGSINANAVRKRRAAIIESLYAASLGVEVLRPKP